MVNVFLQGETLTTINVGDSRAVLAYQQNNQWQIKQLSRDHKPDLEDEKERIIKTGGRVEPFIDSEGTFQGPHRVWLKNENLPGLAMSRSFGDNIAKRVGVTWEPEVT